MINKLMLFMISWLMAVNAFGASSSTQLAPVTYLPRIQCPELTINGHPVNHTVQTIDFGPPVCQSGLDWGPASIAVWIGGINFQGNCPPTAPYLGGFSETWVFVVVFGILGGGSGLNATCCNFAQPPMTFVKDAGSWTTGTYCY
jgi:hypothetical protein